MSIAAAGIGKGLSLETVALCLALGGIDPNEGRLRPSFLKIRRYCELRGCGESKAWSEIKAGQIEAVKDGRNTLIPYRSYLRRVVELAVESGVKPYDGDLELYRACLKSVLAQDAANAAETA
jgi:hypothetical protein